MKMSASKVRHYFLSEWKAQIDTLDLLRIDLLHSLPSVVFFSTLDAVLCIHTWKLSKAAGLTERKVFLINFSSLSILLQIL